MKILSIVAARPNFIKIAPFCRIISDYNKNCNNQKLIHVLVHSGQHYDLKMSDTFFNDLSIPYPDINLEIGSGTHAEQVGKTMIAFEKVLKKESPDWVIVVGDVNATLACALTAKQLKIKVCHIEAGLRSGDLNMPEEINRILTDRLSDLLLTPDVNSSKNLLKEAKFRNQISFVGNIMIDSLDYYREKAYSLSLSDIIKTNILNETKCIMRETVAENNFIIITLHRPSNVDNLEILKSFINFLYSISNFDFPLVWPVHPRAKKMLIQHNLWDDILNHPNMLLLEPIGYPQMLKMNMSAKVMITDSGGLQEECCVLGTPCLILRTCTERPLTLRKNGGTCVLVGEDIDLLKKEFYKSLKTKRSPHRPNLWDGETAIRCLNAILNFSD